MPDAQDEPTSLNTPTPPSTKPLEIDLYCSKCGYNQRSLYGDPVCCPECGSECSIEDLRCPPEKIADRKHSMLLLACYCVLLMLGFIVLFGAFITKWPVMRTALLLCIPAIPWCFVVFIFKNSCLSEPGWAKLLWRFHWLAGTALIGCGLACYSLILAWNALTQAPHHFESVTLKVIACGATSWFLLKHSPLSILCRKAATDFESMARRAEFKHQIQKASRNKYSAG